MKTSARTEYLILSLIVTVIFFAGCVKRTIVVDSNPSGANLWINGHSLGKTPVAYPFITHGRYKFQLEKQGFERIVTREMIRAPIYEWIPLDFFAENLLPIHWEDKHSFRYSLILQSPQDRLQQAAPVQNEALREQLKSLDWRERQSACVALATQRDPATALLALKALKDPRPEVRSVALGAVRSIQGAQALEPLFTALRFDSNPRVRWQAAIELEALKDQRAVPELILALKDKNSLVRSGAAEALKSLPNPLALRPLISASRDRNSIVRRSATEGLGRIGDKSAVPALTRNLFHHDVQTRRKAVEALRKLKDPSSGPALVRTFTDQDPKVRRVATAALIEFGDMRVVPALIRRLRAFRPWTRGHAAQVLGGLKDPRAIEPLQHAIRREIDPPAYAAMLNALKALGAKPNASWERVFPNREKKPQ